MPNSALRDRLTSALVDFAWEEWSQMGVFGAARRRSPWAQDPEALLLLTLVVARNDPRLFDEVLDWLVVNEPVTSVRRLRSFCETDEDRRLVLAVLEWVALRRRRKPPAHPGSGPGVARQEVLFHGSTPPSASADEVFLGHGLLRGPADASGKSREPDLSAPINFAFRLRRLLGVSARAEAVRFLLTEDLGSGATVGAVAASAGYAKRNVHEALNDLHASSTARLVTVGGDQRYALERGAWAQLLGLLDEGLPLHRDWPQLLGALGQILQWLGDRELGALSPYMRASAARDLLEELRPRLALAGVVVAGYRRGEEAWDDLEETVDNALAVLAPPERHSWHAAASFQIYRDSAGGWRWRLIAPNGRIVASSGESYRSRANVLAAVDHVRAAARQGRAVVREDGAGNYRWQVLAANNRTLAEASEAYSASSSAERAARSAQELASSAGGPYEG